MGSSVRTDAVDSRSLEIAAGLYFLFYGAALQQLNDESSDLRHRLAALAVIASWRQVLDSYLAGFAAGGLYRLAWQRRLTTPLLEAYRRAAADFPVPLSGAEIARAANAQAAEAARVISEATAERVLDAARRAATVELVVDFRQEVEQAVAGAAPVRAERISTFEPAFAAAEGEFMAARTSGYELIEWLHSGTPRHPRDWHVRIDGVRVPLGDTFVGTTCRYPRDPRGEPEDTMNCTCSARYWTL